MNIIRRLFHTHRWLLVRRNEQLCPVCGARRHRNHKDLAWVRKP